MAGGPRTGTRQWTHWPADVRGYDPRVAPAALGRRYNSALGRYPTQDSIESVTKGSGVVLKRLGLSDRVKNNPTWEDVSLARFLATRLYLHPLYGVTEYVGSPNEPVLDVLVNLLTSIEPGKALKTHERVENLDIKTEIATPMATAVRTAVAQLTDLANRPPYKSLATNPNPNTPNDVEHFVFPNAGALLAALNSWTKTASTREDIIHIACDSLVFLAWTFLDRFLGNGGIDLVMIDHLRRLLCSNRACKYPSRSQATVKPPPSADEIMQHAKAQLKGTTSAKERGLDVAAMLYVDNMYRLYAVWMNLAVVVQWKMDATHI